MPESPQARYEREIHDVEAALKDCPNILPNEKVDRYWKNKVTGQIVTVLKYEIVDSVQRKIVYTHPTWMYSLTCLYKQFCREFEPYGNTTDRS